MTHSLVDQVLVVLFVAACIVGIICFLWATFFLIRLGFQFLEPRDAFSARTLWNPLNAVFSPELLSPGGRNSRRLFFVGALGFVLSIASAFCVAGLIWIANKMP